MTQDDKQRISQELTSPKVDLLIQNATRSVGIGGGLGRSHVVVSGHDGQVAEGLLDHVKRAFLMLGRVQPQLDGGDAIWTLWTKTDRGPIEDFDNFEEMLDEGEVGSYEEFESLWKTEYPERVQWRRLSVVHYDDRLFFALQKDLSFNVTLGTGVFEGIDVSDEDARRLITWLLESIEEETHRIVRDPEAYNRKLEETLPRSKRFGRIRRHDIWNGSTAAVRLDRELGDERLEAFERLVRELDEGASLDSMTLADFLRYCEICYEACDYDRWSADASSRKKYEIMADGRHEGLLELTPDDPKAFSNWYKDRVGGGHPFEICRGGNSTHISLHVMPHEPGWQLYLAGFSSSRVVETAKMAVALHEREVPFILGKKEEMLRMLKGEDYVGIVPDDMTVGYNHEDFPEADRIYSFAHLWMLDELDSKLVDQVYWYPLSEYSLKRI